MLSSIGYYVQSIDQIAEETEAIREETYPKYEAIRNAVDEGEASELDRSTLEEAVQLLGEGAKKYRAMLKKVSALRPPTETVDIHKNSEKVCLSYVTDYEEMTQGIDPESGIDKNLLSIFGTKQDQAIDQLTAAT